MTIDYQRRRLSQGGPMSVEAYLQLDQNTPDAKYEYLDGVARLMAGGSAEHDRISRNIANAIDEHFASGPCTVFGPEVQTLVGVKSNGRPDYYYPDVTVSCDVADRRRGNKLIQSPRIVVEVLSPSTEHIDRGRKLQTYKACPSVQEILLVSQFARHVEVYRRGEDDTTWTYTQYGPDGSVELPSVDVYITMDEIYKRINFEEPLIEE
jgi:Uma2 family endonuclease